MDDDALEVIAGRWWLPDPNRFNWVLPSGHFVRLTPTMLEGRVVVDSMLVSRNPPPGVDMFWPPRRPLWDREKVPPWEVKVGSVSHPFNVGPVTSAVLRNLTLDNFLSAVQSSVVNANGEGIDTITSDDNIARLRDNGPSTETLTVVADIYRLAYAVGLSPTKRVEEVFSLPRSTAGRWVALARKRGLLGEAPTPGKAGA